MEKISPDMGFVRETLKELLEIPSPTGFTDEAVRYTCEMLESLGIKYEMTRRGGIRANLKGNVYSPDRSVVAHLDTLGAMVAELKDNGRLRLSPIGTWSSRFAEGAHVTIYSDENQFGGTILPLKASGHTFDSEIDTLPVSWDTVELRVDHPVYGRKDLKDLGINVGDFVALDPGTRFTDNGFLCSRYLDDKAGVAVMLAVAREVIRHDVELPLDCHLLFTISEETGSGASAILHGDVAEMVTIDTGPSAPLQNTDEFGVTVCMKDSSGPFDYHLTHMLLKLCRDYEIRHKRDVFRYYRCDSAAAIEAGNDIRTALVCFGTDATHGLERCHENSLIALGELLGYYMQSGPAVRRDKNALDDSLEDFPSLPVGAPEHSEQ